MLDTVAWVLYRLDRGTEAERLLLASLALDESMVDPPLHLAEIYGTSGRQDDALALYARARHIAPNSGRVELTVPAPMREHVERAIGGRAEVDAWIGERRVDYARALEVEPDADGWRWPEGAKAGGTHRVDVVVLVAEDGAVLDVETVTGDEPWATAAAADARELRLPVVDWEGGKPTRYLRTLRFSYQPTRRVTAMRLALPLLDPDATDLLLRSF